MVAETVYYRLYRRLSEHYGPQHWWPGETPLEILVGAVLTQNTNWSNVTRAISNLRERGLLTFDALVDAPVAEVADCIRPSGYYNLKAVRLANLLRMIAVQYHGDLLALLADDTARARTHLLSVKGIGPETADAILLYAGNHAVFVVDAYTHRILSRHGLAPEECDYAELQEILTSSLPADYRIYNEYHALLVRTGKDYCKKNNPLCGNCPLQGVER